MIERTLWYETKDGRREVEQRELLGRPESLVILGEAGMGKTFLLSRLRNAGAPFCTARQLANRPDPNNLLCGGRLLVIDALDEVPTKSEGDAVDRVLQKLGQLGYPRFILSCRAAEWRDASATEAIAEQYAPAPLILHLRPFTDVQATKFLSQEVGETRALQIVAHYRDRGLDEFLGNPQTLELIMRIPGELPETRRALFQSAVDALWQETNDKKLVALDRQSTLDAAGAAFAGLLLTGNSAVVRKRAANLGEGEMPLAEIEAFDGGKVGAVLATRLFASISARSTGLAPTPDDVLALLVALDPVDRSDERWRDVVTLTRHDGDEGAAVRAAARAFALHRHDLVVWLDSLALPSIPEWQIKQDREKRRRAATRV